jgi:RND family efflux transporter MFP subunit
MAMKGIIWLTATVLAIAGGVYYARQKSPETFAARGAAPNSAALSGAPTTFVAAIRDIHFAVTAAGDIGPLDAVSVRPEIGGLIAKLTLDIGDKVKKGDVLFELDDKDLQTEKVSRKTEIAGARLAVETQRLQLEKVKLNFDRVKDLFASKLIAQEAFDNARIDHDLTKNSLDIALNRLETAQTALQLVEDRLLKTVIRAPFDCTILTRPVSVGQAVSGASGFNSGTEVFSVANLADMVITAHINQAEVTRLKVGQTVTVEVEAVPGLKLAGRVDRIAPQATFKSGVKGFSTRILLKNAEGAVRPGMTANLSIPLISSSNVLAIPLGAVFNEKNERFVWIRKDGGSFERRTVQLGVGDFDFVAVTQGLREGEVVSLIAPAGDVGAVQKAAENSGAAAKTR